MSRIRISIIGSLVLALLAWFGCREEIAMINNETPSSVHSLFAIGSDRAVTLGWTGLDVISPGGFQLHRSLDPDFVPSRLTLYASLPSSATQFLDTSVVNGITYYYRIVPVDALPGGVKRPGVSHEVTPARPYDYASVTSIIFSEHIKPILAGGCAVHGCHAGSEIGVIPDHHGSPYARTMHGESLSLADWEDIFKGGEHGAVVIPYRSTMSHLVYHLNSDTTIAPVSEPHMPPGSFSLPDEQRDLLMRWIDGGAANDEGSVAFSSYPEGRVLATNQAEDVIAVVDIRTGRVSRYVQAGLPRVVPPLVPEAPHNLTVDPAGGVYYVNLVNAGKILKYRTSDNARIGELGGILSPTQIALSPSGDTGYVAQFQQFINSIRMFNTRTMELYPEQISHPRIDKPHGVQVTPDGRYLFVTGNLSDNVLVYDLGTHTTDLVWLYPDSTSPSSNLLPYQTVMTADNRFVYVSCQKSNEVRVIDRDSMRVVRVIPVGQWPLIMAMTPDKRFVYVANRNSNDVSVIRTSDQTVVKTIPGVGPQPHGVAIDDQGHFAYVTCENVAANGTPPHHPTSGSRLPGYVTVIDIGTNQIVRQIEVANFAAGIAVIR
jgi:YVTN family beta-propeller protein